MQHCVLCVSGARGETGHAALREDFRSGFEPDGEASYILFSCTICGSRWGRGRGAEAYAWSRKECSVADEEEPASLERRGA